MILEVITRDYTYDPDTGIVSRKGKPVGTRDHRGYNRIVVRKSDPVYFTLECTCKVHHVAWYLTYGEWAPREIDHIDGNGYNNKLSNLRLATHSENAQNMRKLTTRKAGSQYKGVYYHKKNGNWVARIVFKGERISLGSYSTEEMAARVYDDSARTLFGEFARVNFPTSRETTTPHQVVPDGVSVGSGPT